MESEDDCLFDGVLNIIINVMMYFEKKEVINKFDLFILYFNNFMSLKHNPSFILIIHFLDFVLMDFKFIFNYFVVFTIKFSLDNYYFLLICGLKMSMFSLVKKHFIYSASFSLF